MARKDAMAPPENAMDAAAVKAAAFPMNFLLLGVLLSEFMRRPWSGRAAARCDTAVPQPTRERERHIHEESSGQRRSESAKKRAVQCRGVSGQTLSGKLGFGLCRTMAQNLNCRD